MERFYILNPDIRLRGYDRLPYGLAFPKEGRVSFVRKDVFDAVSLCNGKIDVTLPLVPENMRKIIQKLEQEGVVAPCKQGSALLPIQEYKKYPARYIRTVHWSITGGCNFRCRHCYMSAPDAKYGQLPYETVMRMIDELYECGILSVSITGGEPLIRLDFMEIVDALLGREIRITQIYTNGALVTRELLKQLDERGIHPEFNMSFDGVGWHDWLRGVDGAEVAVDRAFLLCRDMGFPTGAEMCIHEKNKHTLRETMRHLKEVGCRSVKTNPVADVGEWMKNGYETLGMDEMYQLYFDYIPQYYEDGMPLSIQLGGFFMVSPGEPLRYDIPMYKNVENPERVTMCSNASILFGIIYGYILCAILGLFLDTTYVVDGQTYTHSWVLQWDKVADAEWFSFPKIMPVDFVFDSRAIIPIMIMFIVTAVETVGDLSGITEGGLGREATDKELSGGVACDGIGSAFASILGVLPNTSFSQNVGLVGMTKIVNLFALTMGAIFLVLCGFCPKLATVIQLMPESVLGGAAVMMFASIVVSGIQLITKESIGSREVTIVAVSLGLGYGLGSTPNVLTMLPSWVGYIFGGSGIVPAALCAIILNIALKKEDVSTESVTKINVIPEKGEDEK